MSFDETISQVISDTVEDLIFIVNSDYEIQYINRKGKEVFKIAEESIPKCYSIICQLGDPPDNCPFHKMEPDSPEEREWTLQILGQTYRVRGKKKTGSDNQQLYIYVYHNISDILKAEEKEREIHSQYEILNTKYQKKIEELRQMNKILQEEKYQFEKLFSNMNSAVAVHEVILDEQGKPCDYRYIDCNSMFEELTGLKKEAIIGKRIREILPNIEQYWIDTFGKVALTGVPYNYTNYAKDLGRYYETRTYSPKRGIFAVTFYEVTDQIISKQKLEEVHTSLEESLRQTQQLNAELEETLEEVESKEILLKTIFNNAPSIMLLLNEKADVLQVNRETLKATGKSPGESARNHSGDILKCIHALKSPEGCGSGEACKTCKLQATILDTIETGKELQKVETEFYRLDENGNQKSMSILISTSKFTSEGKGVTLVTIEDVTQLKEQERKIRESEEKFRYAFLTSPDSININKLDGTFLDINSGFTLLTGYSREEIIGKKSTEVDIWFIPEDRDKLIQALTTKGSIKNLESVFRCKDGSLKTALMSANLITLNNEPCILSITRDSTTLKLDRQFLEKAQEIGLIGSWYVELESESLSLTNETYRIFELSPETKISLPLFMSFVHPEDRGLVQHAWSEALNGVPFDIEHRIKVGKKTKWVHQKADMEFNSKGKAIHSFGVIQDITEQKILHLKNVENENLLQKLFDNLKSGVAIYKPVNQGEDFCFIAFNKGAENISNVSTSDLKGRTLLEEFPNIAYTPFFKALQQVHKTGMDIQLDPFYYKDEKREGWRDGYIYKLPSEEIVNIFSDVTDAVNLKNRQKIESQIAEAFATQIDDELYRTLLNLLLRFFNCSDGFVGYLNNEGELICQSTPDKPEALNEIIGQLSRENIKTRRTLLRNNQPEGVDSPCRIDNLLIAAIYDKNKTIGQVAIANKKDGFSNSDKKEIEQLCIYLAPLMIAAINEIEFRQQIIKEKEKAELADRLKTTFLANMSHEIRTPLNGILGFSDVLISRQDLTSSQKDTYGMIIRKSANNLLRIVNDILDISELESGLLQIYNTSFSLNKFLVDIHNIFRQRLLEEEKNLFINLVESPQDYFLHTDESRLNQIFSNLLDNAIKFTPKGRIDFGFSQCKQNLITFFVRDTGIGIQPDHQEIIFDRFRQGEMSPNREYGGNGLGLAIINELLHLMNGWIWVESEPEKGSCFYFSLPIVQSEELEEKEPFVRNEQADARPGLKILVAEDDPVNIQYFEEILSRIEAEVFIVTDGESAVDMVKNNPFDLVLMDIRMPIMDGLEATRRIRSFNKTIPIIAQTAYAMKSDEQAAFNAGCSDYISKPVSLEKLIQKVNALTTN